MRKKIITGVLVGAVLLTGACEGEERRAKTDGLWGGVQEFTATLEDGRTVKCITKFQYGMSCDWDNAR